MNTANAELQNIHTYACLYLEVMAQTPTKENDSDVASGNMRIDACCVCSKDVNMSSQANLGLPFLQNCFHISLLSVGLSCVSQTVGQQGVGTCMQHTSRHTSLYFFLCEDFYRHNASITGIMHQSVITFQKC